VQPIVTDGAAWSVGRSASLSATIVSPAKTAEPIDMPFGMWTWVGPKNCVLDGVQIPDGKGQFEGGGAAKFKV